MCALTGHVRVVLTVLSDCRPRHHPVAGQIAPEVGLAVVGVELSAAVVVCWELLSLATHRTIIHWACDTSE